MFAFLKKWFCQPKDPDAIDWKTVRLYIKTHRQFDRAYKRQQFNSDLRPRELYDELHLIRARANRATNGAINVAFDLPESFMLDEPLPRHTVLNMSP